VQLDWTTFALEIVNFLVLVWLLARFLYRPVAQAIAERRAQIERGMSAAHEAKAQAEVLQAQYQGRVAEWEREKAQARAALQEALDAERARSMETLRGELERERSRVATLAQRDAAERARQLETEALRQAAAFCARLLRPLAGPELEARIVELALGELNKLPADRRQALRGHRASMAQVASAYPLPEDQRRRIGAALAGLAGGEVRCAYETDESLIAGLRVQIGPWLLGANLRDELAGFAEAGHEGD
jgi:F-type H+-transporting ATPase subunit b